MRKKSVPNYSKWIKKARASRRVNIVACGIGLAATAAGMYLSYPTAYRLPALFAGAAVLLLLMGLLLKNIAEAGAIMRVARTGNYAVMLSDQQQDVIARQQRNRGQSFYLAVFLVVTTPVAAALTVYARVTGQGLYLLLMAGFVLAGLLLTLICSLYQTARLTARDSFCTVSPHGVLLGREILPFEREDVRGLLKFDDYYLLRFRKTELFGMTHKSEVIIPTDGVVRDGIGRTADEEMVYALGLDGLFATPDAWYESRDYGETDSLPDDFVPPVPLEERDVAPPAQAETAQQSEQLHVIAPGYEPLADEASEAASQGEDNTPKYGE